MFTILMMESVSEQYAERWRELVLEHRAARRGALASDASVPELEELDQKYTLLIDLAYAEMKRAEQLELLRRAVGKGMD